MSESGILYVVATPIGNLDDISRRAIEVLGAVDLIAAEDTRHSQKLLQSIRVSTASVSCHDFSSDAAIEKILMKLRDGNSVALISDAGTPLLSDPGYKLVLLSRQHNIDVIPVPGASAFVAALSVSGLATDRFVFEGFLPSKSSARQKRLSELADEQRTLVLYESTHRIVNSLQDMSNVFGADRKIFIAREMTKRFESHFLGSAAQAVQWLEQDENQQKGEFVVLVSGCEQTSGQQRQHEQAMEIVNLLRSEVSMKKAVSLACKITGVRKNRLYASALQEFSSAVEET